MKTLNVCCYLLLNEAKVEWIQMLCNRFAYEYTKYLSEEYHIEETLQKLDHITLSKF